MIRTYRWFLGFMLRQLLGSLSRRLARIGWRAERQSGLLDWTSCLRTGRNGYATLDSPTDWPATFSFSRRATGTWELDAFADPVSPVALGC